MLSYIWLGLLGYKGCMEMSRIENSAYAVFSEDMVGLNDFPVKQKSK